MQSGRITELVDSDNETDISDAPPFEVLKTVDNGGHLQTRIEITSTALVSFLKEACINYPGTEYKALFSHKVALADPYKMLFHNLGKIQELATTTDVLDKLLGFMMQQEAWTPLTRLNTQTCRTIGFKHLWLLYRPGTTVYQRPSEDSAGWRAFKIADTLHDRTQEDGQADFLIRYYSLALDVAGKKLEPVVHILKLRPYMDVRFIVDLQLVPGDYMEQHQVQTIRNALERRGRKYWSFNGHATYQEYNGAVWHKSSKLVSRLSLSSNQ